MKHTIPYGNWTTHLADAIENAAGGDTIVCHSSAMVMAAEAALKRMCPDKTLTFVLEDSP